MDEGRKRVVLIAAAILVARHLKNAEDLDDYRPTPRSEALVANAIRLAERILRKDRLRASDRGDVPQRHAAVGIRADVAIWEDNNR